MESKERRNDLIDLIVDEVKKADSSANNSGQNKQVTFFILYSAHNACKCVHTRKDVRFLVLTAT